MVSIADIDLNIEKYVAFRKAYLEVGDLLGENQLLYEKVLQNQEDIRKILQKGWGY